MVYQRSNQGFRKQVTDKAAQMIVDYNAGKFKHESWCCPSCQQCLDSGIGTRDHAEDCLELRADAANEL